MDRFRRVCRLLPGTVLPSPSLGRVGVHDFAFEACSGFTRVTARRFARAPKAPFITGLRPGQSPVQAACQLPGQPTIARVGLSPTRSSRLRRAHPSRLRKPRFASAGAPPIAIGPGYMRPHMAATVDFTGPRQTLDPHCQLRFTRSAARVFHASSFTNSNLHLSTQCLARLKKRLDQGNRSLALESVALYRFFLELRLGSRVGDSL